MTILCIETSTHVCSAAICKDGMPIRQCIDYEGSNHARLLPLFIDQLLSFAREQKLTIDAVALSEGPGSYTGLRIGTSTAKGLCYGLNIPLLPVPTLDILTLAAKESLSSNNAAVFLPLIDARRMEVYTTGENGKARAVVVENEESLYAGNENVYYFGDGAAKCQAVFTKPNWHYLPNIVPEARCCASYVLPIIDHYRTHPVDIAYYEPYYLKEFTAARSHVKGLK